MWVFEECDNRPGGSILLVRVLVGKVKSVERLQAVLRGTPLREDQEGWNCVSWVKEALESLEKDDRALGTSVTKWGVVREGALSYVIRKKAEHRFDSEGEFDISLVPTWSLLDDKEVVS